MSSPSVLLVNETSLEKLDSATSVVIRDPWLRPILIVLLVFLVGLTAVGAVFLAHKLYAVKCSKVNKSIRQLCTAKNTVQNGFNGLRI